jgi:hypothetical protein
MKTARRIAAMKAIIAVSGLATVGLAVATGNWPVVLSAAAVASGAGLLAALADLRETEARCEAARRRDRTPAGGEPGREMDPDIQAKLAELKRYYARIESVTDGGERRFQDLVSAEDGPGWDRLP